MAKKWLLRALALVLLGAVGYWLFLVESDPVPVKVVLAERGLVEATVTNSKAGTIKARRRAKLSPEIGGRVIEVAFQEGDSVEAGAMILRLGDASQRAQLLLTQRSLNAAEAARGRARLAADLAQRELKRAQRLADRNILSADVLDKLESAYRTAEADFAAHSAEADKVRAEITAAEAEVAKAEVRAPFAGVIAELDVQVGEWITPAPPLIDVPAVVDLIDATSLYVSAPMDEVDSARFRVGQRAKVGIDSYPEQTFPGRIVRVAPYVLDLEAQNRTVEVEVELDDRVFSSTLLPGTSADVEIILDARDTALRIPSSALFDGSRVLLAEGDRLEQREVEIGLKNWDYAEVLGGLEPGQRVVVSLDRAEVRAGVRVEVEDTVYRP